MTVLGTTIDANIASGDMSDQGGAGIFNAGGTLMIADSTIISNNICDGLAGSGGGILNDAGGILTIENTTISGNVSIRAGGGIEDNSGDASLVVLTNVLLEANTTGGSPGNGGAVHITGNGDIQINGSWVIQNQADAEGGGLWNGTGTMTVLGTTIDANIASGDMADQGGAGIFNAGGTLMIADSTIISNNICDGLAGSGGGILNDAGGILTIENTTISGNVSIRAGGGIEDNSGDASLVVLTNVLLEANTTGGSPGNGGAVHITGNGDIQINGSWVIQNQADAEGGGLWNGTGTMTVLGTTIDANIASGDMSDQGGAGIFNAGGTLMIADSTIISNNICDGLAGSGGGILNDAGGILTIENTTISGNVSIRAGGGIEDNSGDASLVVLTNVLLEANTTGGSPGNGGAVHITGNGDIQINGSWVIQNQADAEGGGLWNGTGTMTVLGTTIDANIASGDMSDQGGAGIFNAGGTLMIADSTIISNNICDGSAGSGGGILNDAGGTLTIENTTISGNVSVRAGGGIEDNSGRRIARRAHKRIA
ncbi:MAG: hypothetical protein R2792_16250 [Saprospiraceae bacterium]